MTDNFENHNWFQRPEWTEGCAVIDSFIVAVELWRHTGEEKYLDDAHRIYYSGLGVNQRANGGFGCDSCPSLDDPFLTVRTQEAHWCCTQRGGDGLSRAANYCFFTDETGILVPFFQDSEATVRVGTGTLSLKETTSYPWEGKVRLEVAAADPGVKCAIRLFAPLWGRELSLKLNGRPVTAKVKQGFTGVEGEWRGGDTLELAFSQSVEARPPVASITLSGTGR
jgi:DUF1680 family protein